MPPKRKDYPVTKMFIKGDKNSIICYRAFQYFFIISPRMSCFRNTHHIMTCRPEGISNSYIEHLVEI